ncbi:type II toxin-antitoxin system PemK/MazF family toxin [Catellatospora sp. NPDC049111]|uniref:type II toxin-antitoxin system PemK/MazF family toxin n=1 Tax=Catellatospora sp. NPDC049111 TaxID=3155271 RepID=UPI0034070B73
MTPPQRRLKVAPWQVWWVQFNPQVGHEQAGERPAVVVGSTLACSLPNGLALMVPCTTTDRQLVWQPEINLAGRRGFAMCDQVKALSTDRLVRRHQATLTKPECEAIAFALAQLIATG